MNRKARTAVAGTTVAALAVPASLFLAAPAMADDDDLEWERSGNCRAADFDLNVEKEDGRFKVDADLDDAQPGSRWRVTLFHDGQRFVKSVRRADGDGDIDIKDRVRRDTAGTDTFRLKVKRIGNFKACSIRVVAR